MMILRFSLSILLVSSSVLVLAQGNGQSNFQILHITSAARIAALGGNAISIKDGDLNLGLVAPSLLDSTTAGQIVFGFTRLFGEANIAHAGYAHHLKKIGVLTFSIQSLGYGDFELTDEAGNVQGQFNAGEYIFQGGIGHQFTSRLSAGGNLKFILSELAEYKSTAVAVDLSGTYSNPEKGFTTTLLVKNIGSSLSSYTPNGQQEIPFEIQAGFSKKLEKAPLRFSVIAENLQKWDLTPEGSDQVAIDPLTGEEIVDENGGFTENFFRHLVFATEVVITPNFHLRAGYNYNRRQQLRIDDTSSAGGFSFGLGMRIAKIHLSYARAIYSQAGASNSFTLNVKFDDFKKGN